MPKQHQLFNEELMLSCTFGQRAPDDGGPYILEEIMLTKDDALNATEFHLDGCTRTYGPRGGAQVNVVRYRRNGRTQTWQTRPDDFRVPVVHGLRSYDQIYSYDALHFHTAETCPLTGTCCTCGDARAFACFCECHRS